MARSRPGTRVYTVVTHVARSGMSRSIQPMMGGINHEDEPIIMDLTWRVARANPSLKFDRDHGGIKMTGCGMDMGFALVYEIGRMLYPDGFALAPGQHARNGDKSNIDKDGGYALRHERL